MGGEISLVKGNLSSRNSHNNVMLTSVFDYQNRKIRKFVKDVARQTRSSQGKRGVKSFSTEILLKFNMRDKKVSDFYVSSPEMNKIKALYVQKKILAFKKKFQAQKTEDTDWAKASRLIMWYFCNRSRNTEENIFVQNRAEENTEEARLPKATGFLLDYGVEVVPGDLLSVRIGSTPFSHYGVYLGRAFDEHFVADLNANSKFDISRSCTRVRTVNEFAGENPKYLLPRKWVSLKKIHSLETIFCITQALMGKEYVYGLINHNCESFSTFVYSGFAICQQSGVYKTKYHKSIRRKPGRGSQLKIGVHFDDSHTNKVIRGIRYRLPSQPR